MAHLVLRKEEEIESVAAFMNEKEFLSEKDEERGRKKESSLELRKGWKSSLDSLGDNFSHY